MMLYDVVWCCMMLFDVVWCCMMLYDVVWRCMMLFYVVWCCMMLYGVVWFCMMFHPKWKKTSPKLEPSPKWKTTLPKMFISENKGASYLRFARFFFMFLIFITFIVIRVFCHGYWSSLKYEMVVILHLLCSIGRPGPNSAYLGHLFHDSWLWLLKIGWL